MTLLYRVSVLAALFAFSSASGIAAPLPEPRVSVRALNEPVRTVLFRIAHETGASIVIDEGVSGYVTVALHRVPIAQALTAILTPLGETFRFREGVYVISRGAPVVTPPASGMAPTVIGLSVITPKRAAAVLRPLFPQAAFREDDKANALVVLATAADVQAMRTVLQGLDVRNPTLPTTEALVLRNARAATLVDHLGKAFPKASFSVAGEKQLLVTAGPIDLVQIKAAVNGLDAPSFTPPPAASSSEAVHVSQRAPREIARALSAQLPGLRAAVSGSAVMLSGPPEAVQRAKALVAQLDLPQFGERYTQVYRIRSLDAASVAELLRRSFSGLEVTVDPSINALAVMGTAAQHGRIADALAQLDPPPGAQPAANAFASGGSSTEVVMLKSYIPGQAPGAIDAVQSMTQALQVAAPEVRVVQLPTPGQIALLGPAHAVRSAQNFIAKVDVVPPLVVLDTEILEVDETVAKNLGLQLGTAALSTTFSELPALPNADGTPGRLGKFQALTRTPISFIAQLNLLVQNGKGRVLADPRITTLSGRTASIRAGDTISILTTTAGNLGTIATTQVQSFQTGVTLDITPSVAPDGGINVTLHPVVNSLIGTNNGVPEISTRDTQTTVHLHDDETLIIGGLIQENETRTTTKLPLLGDLPLVGRVFRNDNVQAQRNELIIVVTPHIVKPGAPTLPGPTLHALPSPAPLPTLPPNTRLPAPSGQLPHARDVSTRMAIPPAPRPTATPLLIVPPSATPVPQPTAFAQTNVFTFGSAPQSNFAKATDPVQIFYATLSPTVVSNGTPVRIAAVTTSNATAVKLIVGTQTISLVQTGAGQWQAGFPFSSSAVPAGQSALQLSLVASRSDGTSATVPIPVNTAAPP